MKQTLDLPPGTAYIRTAVLDAANGHTGATEFEYNVPKPNSNVAHNATQTVAQP